MRSLWHRFCCDINADAIIFVVDSSDSNRFDEASDALQDLLSQDGLNESLPVLVLANKQDRRRARGGLEIGQALGLGRSRKPWHVHPCCALDGKGIPEGLDWICEKLFKNCSMKENVSSLASALSPLVVKSSPTITVRRPVPLTSKP